MIVAERDIDLFAGPGGWDEGAAELGIRPLGIEWDDAACATRRARGHETLQADVAALDPQDFAPCRLLIASAPCQAFSMAGLGAGRKALQAYIDAIKGLLETGVIDRESLDEKCADPRGHLVLEPLRWAMQLRPAFVALEQVEPVLPLWEAIAAALRQLGYGVWTGVLLAERYGVPQTRRRAILLAKLGGEVSEPPATHQRYIPPRVKAKQGESLFDAPEPERIVAPEDRELLPWVSMAEALGWGMTARPSVTVASGGENRRGAKPLGGGSGSQAAIDREQDAGAWRPSDQVGFPRRADDGASVEIDGQDYRRRDFRRASEPAFALTEKARSAVRLRANAQAHACERSVDEPAPTITGGHDTADRVWVTEDAPTHMNTGRDWKPGGTREDAQKIPTSEPCPAFTAKLGGQAQWVNDRPATTVAGDARVFPPGHKINQDDIDAGRGSQQRSGAGWTEGRPSTTVNGDPRIAEPGVNRKAIDPETGEPYRQFGDRAVRVSVAEASVLQSFPPDYPWQGTRTAQYRQIGDAVPPALARACLAHLLR